MAIAQYKTSRAVPGIASRRGRRLSWPADDVSAEFSDVELTAKTKIIGPSGEPPAAVETNRYPIWFMVLITAGLLATVAWTGFLVWVAGRIFDVF